LVVNKAYVSRANKLIQKHCCNYFQGDCVLLDSVCPQLRCETSILCKHALSSIILDNELYSAILGAEPSTTSEGKNKVIQTFKKTCKSCNRNYTSKSRNSQYCPRCSKATKRDKARLRKQKTRTVSCHVYSSN
jgi:predicted RNA-binding Zn-ribbon protein involved in translation (DUF1610 family)